MIHHHGSEAATDASTAMRLRSLSHTFTLRLVVGPAHTSRHVQYPMTTAAESQVITTVAQLPRLRT